jgi:hypothetical protein
MHKHLNQCKQQLSKLRGNLFRPLLMLGRERHTNVQQLSKLNATQENRSAIMLFMFNPGLLNRKAWQQFSLAFDRPPLSEAPGPHL